MIYAHRGNIDGPTIYDNGHLHLKTALSKGYGIEIDVWGRFDGTLWVGHDKPEWEITPGDIWKFASFGSIIFDCKNYSAMKYIAQRFGGPRIDAYYYIPDHPVFSMKGRLVLPPHFENDKNCYSIQVMPEQSTSFGEGIAHSEFLHIVTDYPGDYNGT